jgi:hypothetical protein
VQDALAVDGSVYLPGIASPGMTANRLYASGGSLYWAGSAIGGASTGNWTSNGTNVWRSGGAVGIGTSSPSATLSVAGSGYFTGWLGIGTTSPSRLLTLESSSATGTILRMTNTSAGGHVYDFLETGSGNTGGAGRLDFFDSTVGVARLSIAANGNIGVGSTTPWGDLSVSNFNSSSPEFVVGSSTATSLFVSNAGNVGIGTAAPATALDVRGDISNLASSAQNPSFLGSATTGSAPYSLAVQGRYVYVVNFSSNSLQIFDVTNPANLQLVGSTTSSLSSPRFIQVVGRYAYVVNFGSSSLAIFDIANPSSQALVGITSSASNVCSNARFLSVSGKYAYLGSGSGSGGICVYDVSNPTNPRRIAITSSGSQMWGVYVQNRYLYVAGYGSNTLQIWDISNPATSTEVGSASTGASSDPAFVTVSGRYAYVVNNLSNTLQIFDVSNPSSPVSVSTTTVGTTLFEVFVAGRYAYVSSYGSGLLQVFDVSTPSAPVNVGSVNVGSGVVPIVVAGRYAYTALESGTLKIYDVSGIETTALLAGSVETGDLQVSKNAAVANQFQVGGGLNVGSGGIFSDGALGIAATSSWSYFGGSVGIGTTTPYSRLEVFGPDAASSTSAFAVVNTSSSTVFAVFDGGNAQLSGTLTQSSDQRLKTNIQALDGSSSLAEINALNPVTFNWIDPNQDARPQLGFIAQQVQGIFPSLVSTTSATALTPGGTLGLNYIDLISPIVAAIQELDKEITALASTVAGFAQSLTTQQLCVGNGPNDPNPLCVTKSQLAALPASANQSASAPASPSSSPSDATNTPPVIQINGDNPAVIQVGATYTDLGATITGPQADLNLGIQTYLNGLFETPIELDTSSAATDTIAYVVADSQGLTSTSTRTVIVEAATTPSAPPPSASSTGTTTGTTSSATSTPQ